jgi:3-oxoacyl-[acyl-carrier-protein] synthase II
LPRRRPAPQYFATESCPSVRLLSQPGIRLSIVPPARQVVVTGLGAVTAVGHSVDDLWRACLEARSGVRLVEAPWIEGKPFHSRIGGQVRGLSLERHGYSARDERWLDPVSRQALAATAEALACAGLSALRSDGKSASFVIEGLDPTRAAVVLGTGMGGLGALEAGHEYWLRTGSAVGSGPLRQTVTVCIPNAPAAQVAIRYGLQGECKSVTTACAAGTMAIGDACRLIWTGAADLAIAGGTESVLSDHDGLGLLGFDAMGCLSGRNDDPSHASRPFDSRRDGFVLADGAGVVILESAEHARARGARPLATIASYASACQALSMVQPDAEGVRPARVLTMALRQAGVAPSELGAYCAHATSTEAGDAAEARAVRIALGDSAREVPVFGIKGVTGHAIAASGPVEIIACVRALSERIVPPTTNLEEIDPECALRHVKGEPQALRIPRILKASFGFGGHDAALVLEGGSPQ